MRKRTLWPVVLILLLAACSQDPTEKPLETPQLREYSPEVPGQFGALVQPPVIAPPGVSVAPLELAVPTCRETPSATLACTGWIANTSDVPYRDVEVRMELVDEQNRVLASVSALIARDWLPAAEGSPYRVIFEEIPGTSVTPRLILSSAEALPATSLLTVLEVRSTAMEALAGNQFRVSGEVFNQTDSRLAPVRVVAALVDSGGTVTGYRTIELEPLAAGQSATFETIITAEGAGAVRAEVSSDGYRR